MDIFLLLLPSCGWCVNQFHFLFLFLSFFLFNFFWLHFKSSFSFPYVASLGIKAIFPLVISSLSIIRYTVGWSQCLESISLKLLADWIQ